jgi:hypothetical protein
MKHLHCKGCDETQPLFTRLIFNPEAMVATVERFALAHGKCASFKNPAKARAALRWTRMMNREARERRTAR